jgi:hypothetical protein
LSERTVNTIVAAVSSFYAFRNGYLGPLVRGPPYRYVVNFAESEFDLSIKKPAKCRVS